MPTPHGVQFNPKPGTTEFQIFPEEYFSGCDVQIYFGDVWVDDVTGLAFDLYENKRPVYGYASHTYDAVAHGTRLARGQFKIAFKEAGYLNAVLSHIGQVGDSVRPALAYMMNGQSTPQWHAEVQERIEDLLNGYHPPEDPGFTEEVYEPNWPYYLQFGDKNPSVTELKQVLHDRGGYDYSGRNFNWIVPMQRGHVGPAVKEMKWQLWAFGVLDHEPNSDEFEEVTEGFVKAFQQKVGLTPTGIVDQATKTALEAHPETDPQYYGTNTMLRVVSFQRDSNLGLTGVVGEWTRKALAPTVTRRVPKQASVTPGSAEERFAAYEKEIWGRDFSSDADHKYQTFFYQDKAVQDAQQPMLQSGFNIYITYGPIQSAVKEGQTVPNFVDINTTVKAIRNVQLMKVSQLIGPNGQPIEEVYDFIAKDID